MTGARATAASKSISAPSPADRVIQLETPPRLERGGVFASRKHHMRAALLLSLTLTLAACNPPAATAPAETPEAAPAERPDIVTQAAPQTPQQALAAMPSWETARAAGVDFRAVGQEPGWLLDIHQRGIIKFSWDYGDNYAEFAIADPTHPQEGVTRYEAHSDGRALVVTIRRTPCNDAMSGQPYPSTVDVVIDGRALNGCGRSV
jgi:uncharacterized membrane protein